MVQAINYEAMEKYEEIRREIDACLMYLSLVYLTPDSIVATRRNSRIKKNSCVAFFSEYLTQLL
ncbi:hypothetical protein SFC43_14305 [Bacteroides sp. CR5/BHMF/2]|nr:hypothetical protein [Bacteroides sp. CR5/BHMF/2]